MALVNEYFLQLSGNYLFAEISQKVNAYKVAHPGDKIISLGIGDVTRPIAPAVIRAMQDAVSEMAVEETMRGYPPYYGYEFLKEAIVAGDYRSRGVSVAADEIFVSDGAKSDTGNIGDILSVDNIIAVTDPVYPVYVDVSVIAGRAGSFADGRWSNIEYLPCTESNGFIPDFPRRKVDVVYLCYPNNPTGTALNRQQLGGWVEYALQNDVLILFDAAYEAYIGEEDVPHSIYEIDGAKQVAIEFRSFSKTAGFTGLRCGYTVIPKELKANSDTGTKVSLNELWKRRQSTKFNGTSYIVQRAAEAVYSAEGRKQVRETIDYYMGNARIIKAGLESIGMTACGGVNAPYIWIKTPDGMTSWEYFDYLLNRLQIVCTPGAGFGKSGEGFVRMTAFGRRSETLEAMERLKKAGVEKIES
jgi:LL-diaminopimelate aminotransferase